ncbi:MAG TPA: hypothetical protein VNO30_19680 [Kofleriaceae bacterium]|nr:hypothetical protein [Kofleriaceae bacterium]
MDEIARALLDRIAASRTGDDGGGGDDDSDADHLVLADHLMQIGEPDWGELIALACAESRGALPSALRHRLFLLRGRARSWLGPVKAVTFQRRFDRGLLVATGVDARQPGMIAAAASHLAWRTVREVALHEHAYWAGHFRAGDEIAALLCQLPALAALRGVTMDVVLALSLAWPGEAPLPVRALELFFYRPSDDPMYGDVHELLGGPVFAGVRDLALGAGIHRDRRLDPAELDWWLGAAPIMAHVEALGLGYVPDLEPWRLALARSARPGLRACRGRSAVTCFKLERDEAGAWTRLLARGRGDPSSLTPRRLDHLELELGQLAPGALTRLALQVPPALRGDLEPRLPRIAARQPRAAIEVTDTAAAADDAL